MEAAFTGIARQAELSLVYWIKNKAIVLKFAIAYTIHSADGCAYLLDGTNLMNSQR